MTDKLTCIIIDDNPQCISALINLLDSYFPEVNILGESHSVAEGVKLIKQYNPDILFLDIEMPSENGTALFDYLDVPTFETIFTTAYRDYAAQAFRLGSIDYLIKPVKPSDLKEAISKVKEKRNQVLESQDLIIPEYKQTDRITLSDSNTIEVYAIQDILFCQAESNYTIVQGLHKKSMISKTLAYYEDLFVPYGFFRINRSQLINLKHVQRVEKAEGEVVLTNDFKVFVSGRRKKAFFDLLTNSSY